MAHFLFLEIIFLGHFANDQELVDLDSLAPDIIPCFFFWRPKDPSVGGGIPPYLRLPTILLVLPMLGSLDLGLPELYLPGFELPFTANPCDLPLPLACVFYFLYSGSHCSNRRW
jgi:hypothetical protein